MKTLQVSLRTFATRKRDLHKGLVKEVAAGIRAQSGIIYHTPAPTCGLLFQISIKPGRNFPEALNSSVGATFSPQSVTLFGKDNKFCIHT